VERQTYTNDDGYVYVIGHDDKLVTRELFDHSLAAERYVDIDIWAKNSHHSRSEKFQILSGIPYLHWNLSEPVPNVQLIQALSVGCPGYLPVSIRNRYIHYTMAGEPDSARVELGQMKSKPEMHQSLNS